MLGFGMRPGQALMSYSYRYGLALTLLLTVMFVAATSLWERSYISAMKASSASIFKDRLMPATILFRLSDRVYEKRLVVEEHVLSDKPLDKADVYYRLGQIDASIFELLARIDETYLVADESKGLSSFRAELTRYNRLEKQLLEAAAAGGKVGYDAELRKAFGNLRAELTSLTEIQEDVGKQLSEESVEAAASANSLTHLQVGVAFVLALLSAALAIGLQAVNRKPTPGPVSKLH